MKYKATGRPGSWFARIARDENETACIHKRHLDGLHYCDPGYVAGDPKWEEFVDAIRESAAVILTESNDAGRRTSYRTEFYVDNIITTKGQLRLDIVGRGRELE